MRRRRMFLWVAALLSAAAAGQFALSARLGPVAVGPAAVAAGASLLMAAGAARAARRSARDAAQIAVINDILEPPPRFVGLEEVPRKDGHLFHGWGIPINWEVRQKIAEMTASTECVRPQHWAAIVRTLLERGRVRPIFTPIEVLFQMVQIAGMIGSGKSRQLELLGVQAAALPDFGVGLIDPKGDPRLTDWLYTMAKLKEKPWYPFSPEYPALSIAYNPLGECRTALAVADLMKSALPSNNNRGEPYAATQHGVMLDTTHALLELGITPSFWRLRYHIEGGGREALFMKLLRKTYPKGEWGNRLGPALEKYVIMVTVYERGGQSPPWFRPSETLGRLAHTISERDTIGKMSISMMPLLKTLSDGALRGLMSAEDGRRSFSWAELARRHGVASFYLSALSGTATSSVLAKVFLLDLKRTLGDLLSYRPQDVPRRQMVLLVDESARAAPQDDFTDLVGMARAPRCAVIAATQTMSDYVAKLGEAQMRQLLTNMGTFIQFRGSALDAELFADGLGTAHVRSAEEQYTYRPALLESGDRENADFDARLAFRTSNDEVDLVPPAMITGLPRFHFLMRYGSEVWLGWEPLLRDPARAFLREADERIGRRPPGVPGVVGRALSEEVA